MTEAPKDLPVVDSERRFSGIARLYGRQALAQFARSHVAVIGVGGVGSWAVEALARSGIGMLTLYDLDHVAESNVNRQLHALEGSFGKAKVLAMKQRVLAINPSCQVYAIEQFIESESLRMIAEGGFDFVIDCIDNYRIKAALIAFCRRRKIPVITVGAAGGQCDPTKILLADLSRSEQDPLLSKCRKLLRREYGFPSNTKRRFDVPCVFSTEQQRYPDIDGAICQQRPSEIESSLNCGGYGSVMTVTASFGLVAVSHVLNRLAAA
ncbi:MAG: tRNA cyclic N6-threonylcarbamoyladenosine(37) synthase TcdA [gamma proteobacterium symbiont of Ctena orbiculata]|nr:MAG: tRNA cyclic N6-threonylcarbamoyladenosine(37) synthase TcdA [gamma proteobacterium symbiont of Ctena orbiculata]PVV17188.1 MAG: tRNA cyclic N6-threonylcarbamoyladenosine(37) synthase TcdA [gamma proteobacterium symbiont of Ctena orbiculata]